VMTPDQLDSTAAPLSPLELHDYLTPTGYAPFAGGVWEFAARHAQNESGLAKAHEVMAAVRGELVYDAEATDVQTRADEVLALGRGVCQDFAHVMLACLRAFGLAARYVSGYLVTNHVADEATLVGADASHAWVSVRLPGGVWLDLDPTNDVIPTDRHIAIAYGRDYADVPPTRGVFKGAASETLAVRVGLQAL